MTNREIGFALRKLIREEREITNEILRIINVALENRAYLEHGFDNMFNWLTQGFCYSNGAAHRRLEAARLVKVVPEAAEKLVSGQISLTNLCKAESAIKAQEKATGSKLSAEQKTRIVEKIEGKSSFKAEQILCSLLPEAGLDVWQEKKTVVDENTTRFAINFSNKTVADLQRAKEVLSHKFPNASTAEIIAHALKFMLDQIDPLITSTAEVKRIQKRTKHNTKATDQRINDEKIERANSDTSGLDTNSGPTHLSSAGQKRISKTVPKRNSNAGSKRISKAAAKRITIKSANASCTYKDPLTGRRCGSRNQIEIDHIIPKALGGGDQPENLRVLCRQHNLHAAEKVFGKEHMDHFRRR